MGFLSSMKNFGSKILGGIKKAASWIAPTLNKVMNIAAAPVGMINPAAGAVMS
jgi:hypothetical protein